MTGILLNIAGALSRRATFSTSARKKAADAVIDTLGCMIAGAEDNSVIAVTEAFPSAGPGGSSVLVTGGHSTPSIAALVNGTAAHALDFDDNFHPARAHASAVLVPALMAVTTADRAVSGIQFLDAYLVGLEAQAAVGYGVNPSHYNRGWHGTSTVGAIGAAAGVAHLLGAGIDEMAQAMSLATSMAGGPKGQFGTLAKPIHAGLAARNAVEAAMLALSEVAGRLDILERPQGFLDLFGGDEARGWSDWQPDETPVIESRGLVTKLHPCCASTHRAIDALLDLVQEHALDPEDIAAIDTKVGISAVKNLAYPSPADLDAGAFLDAILPSDRAGERLTFACGFHSGCTRKSRPSGPDAEDQHARLHGRRGAWARTSSTHRHPVVKKWRRAPEDTAACQWRDGDAAHFRAEANKIRQLPVMAADEL